jgi:hypothetical protein
MSSLERERDRREKRRKQTKKERKIPVKYGNRRTVRGYWCREHDFSVHIIMYHMD